MHQRRERSSATMIIGVVIVLILVVLPVLYILSLGPLISVLESAGVDESDPMAWIAVAYIYPASMLHDTGHADWIEDYVDWWTT